MSRGRYGLGVPVSALIAVTEPSWISSLPTCSTGPRGPMRVAVTTPVASVPSEFVYVTVRPISDVAVVSPLRRQQLGVRLGQLFELLDHRELRRLRQELGPIRGVGRVLVPQLRNQQLQERVLSELFGSLRGRGRLRMSQGARAGRLAEIASVMCEAPLIECGRQARTSTLPSAVVGRSGSWRCR